MFSREIKKKIKNIKKKQAKMKRSWFYLDDYTNMRMSNTLMFIW